MDKSSRIRLIRMVRDYLETVGAEDQNLLLHEFGFGARRTGWNNEELTLTKILQLGDEQDLVGISSHIQSEASPTSDLTTPPSPASGPLLLFASHLAMHKRLIGEVASELARFGVTLFVAHTSIEPDAAWHVEIIRTLDTSHAGVAFLHSGFKESSWCDQEVGWLLGRRVPVFSLMFDQSPYGPLGERQAINCGGLDASGMASSILDVMLGRSELHPHIASSLVQAMNASPGFSTTDNIWRRLRQLRNLTLAQCEVLLDAVEHNDQVAQARNPWPTSPWDDGRPYAVVIPEFIEKQPGASADVLRARLVAWLDRLDRAQ